MSLSFRNLAYLGVLVLVSCDSQPPPDSDTEASAERYFIRQQVNTGQFGGDAKGQSFTPSVGLSPKSGGCSNLELISFSLVSAIHGVRNAPSESTFLNIYDGSPDSGFEFVGSSTNSVDTQSVPDGEEMTWRFDGLSLDPNRKYWAIMSATESEGDFSVGVGIRTSYPNDVYPGGAGLVQGGKEQRYGHDAVFSAEFRGR